ncbi:MAG: flagellar basal body-associated FliL family protein [Deltaproteobacteria bacterium]|nr:flagellar basal body-associated FliL family protein [Deltaproteobacteria bacterium]MBW2069722.1 flagellar basal body-associated FliL family protein [Deltaproteobacteria bacterium]
MADEQKNPSSKDEQPRKKSKKKLFIILGISMLILLGGGGVAWKTGLASKFLGKDSQQEQKKSSSEGGSGEHMGPIYSLGTFVVNLNDPVRRSYLKIKADLELSNDKASQLVEERLPQLRDTIILILSSKNFEDILSIEGKMRLRQELLRELNRRLGKDTIKTMYFTEFVVQ